MEKILIVEDEEKILNHLADFLKMQGYDVLSAPDGEEGLRLARERKPDLILLDIILPKINGYDVCKQIREEDLCVPILMLTAKGEEVDKVLGLELGADDYVTKPFSLRELLARIRALLRRRETAEGTEHPTFRFGDVEVRFKSYEVVRKGEVLPLSRMEFDVLKYMILHRGEVVSRSTLLDKVWGYDRFPTTRTVDNHIMRLRRKVEEDPENPHYILTVHGVGYKFTG